MPTPVGHALGGLAIYLAAKDRPIPEDVAFAVTCLGVSVLPDLDFAIGPFAGRSYHHYFSHSIGFAALFAVVTYAIARGLRRTRPFRDTGVLLAVYLSHIFLDLLGKDTTPPLGVQLFWPFSAAFHISPVFVFGEVWRGTLGKLFGLHNWMTVAREVLVLSPVCALLWWRARGDTSPTARATAASSPAPPGSASRSE